MQPRPDPRGRLILAHPDAEALKLAFADRERYYGDSREVPIAELIESCPGQPRKTAASRPRNTNFRERQVRT
jgi:hypothetical protein